MSDFPSQPEQLTAEWLGQSLGYKVNEFIAEPLGEGVGVIGLVTRVNMKTDQGIKTIIAKFPAAAAENRAVADLYSMYEREYLFYTQIAPDVPVHAPACYHAEFNGDNNDFVLLLEDLQGYRLGDQVLGCDVEEAELIVRALGAFHRSTWKPDRFKETGTHNTEAQIQGMTTGFEMGWPVVKAQFPEIVTEDIFHKANIAGGMHTKVGSLVNSICEPPLCIAHGDLRLDNVFFGENEIALVDFQATCKSAPEHDLAYFVTQSLKTDVRNARDWVAIYHQELTATGLEYSLDDCRERYRHCALYFLCYAVVICSALDLGNDRGRKMAETLLGNSLESILELDAFDLLETL